MVLALVAVSATAASIDWSFSGITTTAKRIKDSAGNDFTGSVYLILASDASTLNTTSADAFQTSLDKITIGTKAVDSGRPGSDVVTSTSALLANTSTEYTFQVVVYDGTGFYLSATQSNYAYNLGTDDPSSVTFTAQNIGNTYTSGNDIKWTAVPEPASAMLALAGVAMLIRRRK